MGELLSENALCEVLFMEDQAFNIFQELVKALIEDGRMVQAKELVARAVAICEKRSRWGMLRWM